MKPIVITIKPPITERCSKCDYSEFYSFTSSRIKCPKCGCDSVRSVYQPKTNAIWVSVSKGSYYLTRPNEKQFCYKFYNLPDGLKCNYIVEDSISTEPLECARKLKTIIDSFLFSSAKEEIAILVKYLESVEDEQSELRLKEKQEKLEFELYKLLYINHQK